MDDNSCLAQTPQIHPATIQDAEAMAEIEQASFQYDIITKAAFRRFLSSGRALAWLLYVSEAPAGYALALTHKGQKTARIYGLAVHPDYRGKGYAELLMQTLEAEAISLSLHRLRLEVKVDNAPARALYEKYGYMPSKIIKNYYTDGADALQMHKTILPKPIEDKRNAHG